MTGNPVPWFEIYVQDMPRAKVFYEAVLNIELKDLPAPLDPGEDSLGEVQMLAFPMVDGSYGASGALVKMADAPSGAGGTLVYFGCEDCADEAARVAENGGSVIWDKRPIGEYGFIALVNDTEGNTIGLHSMQ